MYTYRGRNLKLNEEVQRAYDESWLGPITDDTVKEACYPTDPADMTDEALTAAVDEYIRSDAELNGIISVKEHSEGDGYRGNLSEENLVKSDMSPEDEFEIKERLFGDHNSTEMIPIKEYPVAFHSIISRWRSYLEEYKTVPSKTDVLFAQISVIYKGCHYAFNPVSLGGNVGIFLENIEEIANEFVDAGCAVRTEVWYR